MGRSGCLPLPSGDPLVPWWGDRGVPAPGHHTPGHNDGVVIVVQMRNQWVYVSSIIVHFFSAEYDLDCFHGVPASERLFQR